MMWNIWKERCRQAFDNKAMLASQLQQEIKNDVGQWTVARRAIPMVSNQGFPPELALSALVSSGVCFFPFASSLFFLLALGN
jgi:hypothetical protein